MPPYFHKNNKNFVSIRGGATLLLTKPSTVVGGELSSNKIVGITSPSPKVAPPLPYTPFLKPTSLEGGELLNKISQLSFQKNARHQKRDNIKFVF